MKASRKLVVIDFDSTLINEEGLNVLARASSAKIADKIAELTDAAMSGKISFEESLTTRVAALKGTPAARVSDAASSLSLTPGAEELVSGLRSIGWIVGAISGGFKEMVQPIAEKLGLDFYEANSLGVSNGFLTGKVQGRIIDTEAKEKILLARALTYGVSIENTVAIGDGANDVAMLKRANLGIAFMAKPAAVRAADHAVTVRDLRLVLKLATERG